MAQKYKDDIKWTISLNKLDVNIMSHWSTTVPTGLYMIVYLPDQIQTSPLSLICSIHRQHMAEQDTNQKTDALADADKTRGQCPNFSNSFNHIVCNRGGIESARFYFYKYLLFNVVNWSSFHFFLYNE